MFLEAEKLKEEGNWVKMLLQEKKKSMKDLRKHIAEKQ